MVNHTYRIPLWTATSRSAISVHVLRYFKNCCSMLSAFDKIEYRKWTTTDRSTLETIHQSVDEFIQSFTEHLQHILPDFIAKVQTSYYQDLRDNMLGEKEILVVGHCAENFTFVMQDEVQSYHWNNDQLPSTHLLVTGWRTERQSTCHMSA